MFLRVLSALQIYVGIKTFLTHFANYFIAFCENRGGLSFGKKWFGEIEFYGLGDYYTTIFPGCGGRVGFGYRF